RIGAIVSYRIVPAEMILIHLLLLRMVEQVVVANEIDEQLVDVSRAETPSTGAAFEREIPEIVAGGRSRRKRIGQYVIATRRLALRSDSDRIEDLPVHKIDVEVRAVSRTLRIRFERIKHDSRPILHERQHFPEDR